MHELHELKEMLCKELEEYGKKGELTAGSLDVVDKLAHSIKNLDKIIDEYEEDEYSNRGSYEGRRSYRDRSYARGRGRNARRDAMGRYSSEGYSRADDMIGQLHELMEDAPDERTRMEMQKFISKMENMM
jgi:hypothetical protein